MILPGDILWDRFRVVRVETEPSRSAWLAPLNAGTPDSGGHATHLLLSLEPSGRSALGDLLAAVRRGAAALNGESRVKLPLLGDVEWRGAPETGGVALLEATPATPLDAPRKESAPPAVSGVLKLISHLAAVLERLYAMAASAKPKGSGDFCRAAAALLNPKATSLSSDGSRLLFSTQSAPPAPSIAPPYWTFYAAPEAVAGRPCGEPALVFGIARVALALLFDPNSSDAGAAILPQGWQRLSVQDIAFKEFKRDPRAAALPKEFSAMLAKCLRPLPASRFTTLAKFRAALKKLIRVSLDHDDNAALSLFAPLTEAGAPKIAIPSGMTLVGAGQYLSGEKKSPRTLRAFAIDITPVTERDYREFLKELKRDPVPDGPGSRGLKYDKHPVVNITWREAEEYAEHHGKRLPTVYEWEKAARGKDGRKFPYGNDYVANTGKLRANGINSAPGKESIKETAPAGSFHQGASPYGVLDTAGNVLEWTSTARRQGDRIFRALKGACFLDGSVELSRCAAIQYKKPDTRENCVGFRCVKDLE